MQKMLVSNSSYTMSDLIGIFPWIPSGPVLDIGCRDGSLSCKLASYGFDVTAFDIDARNIENAYRSYGDVVDWQVYDLRLFPFKKNYYSAIFCMYVFPFIPNEERKKLVQILKNSLKEGGILVLSGFNQHDQSKNKLFARKLAKPKPEPTGIFEQDELISYFKGWEILHNFDGVSEDDHEPEGKHIHGNSEVIVRKPTKIINKSINWLDLPKLGIGVGWRNSISDYLRSPKAVDFVEIITDEYFDLNKDESLNKLIKEFTVAAHGIELSIGSAYGVDLDYVNQVKRVVDRCNSPWWSDHLCFTRSELHKTFTLNPLPATEEALEVVCNNIKTVKKHISLPLLLENPAYYMRPSHSEMSDAEFSKRVALQSDTGILLDIANLYGNAVNLKLDPYKFIDDLPEDRVIQVHLAGGRVFKKLLFDTHDRPIWKETWDILEYALKKCNIKAISIERDDNYHGSVIEEISKDVEKSRKLFGVRI